MIHCSCKNINYSCLTKEIRANSWRGDEDGRNEWLRFCPCVMYAVGDIQGINNRLGPQWLQNTTSPPWGNQPITALRCLWLTVSQSGPFVHLTERPQTLLSLALSLSLSVRPHCQSDAGLTSWSQDQTEKETGKSLWSVKLGTHANPRAYTQANTLTHSKTHSQSSPLFFDTCRLHWGGGAEEKGFNQQFYCLHSNGCTLSLPPPSWHPYIHHPHPRV